MSRGIALLLAAALMAGPALAEAPVACHPDQLHQIADAPVDMGEGMVYQYIYPGATGLVDGLVNFVDCASGTRIVAALPPLNVGDQRTVDDVVEIMTLARASETVFTVQDVLEAMTEAGAPAQLRSSPREACGCALYYPELRGDKEPWAAP